MGGRGYSGDELQRILNLRQRGVSVATVARELGRTPNAIQCVLRTRGWVDPVRSRMRHSIRILSPEQREVFRDFVRSRAAVGTPSDIRDEWNAGAVTKRWPSVNNERVIYYLRELGLEKTRGEYMQFESYRRRQHISQTSRRKQERETRRRALRSRRAELYERERDIPRRRCETCRETWPLTTEFFPNAGNKLNYFLRTCRLCYRSRSGTAAEKLKQRMLVYDREVVTKQIAMAKAERDLFIRQHRHHPTRQCTRCHEVWELLTKRFPEYKGANGEKLYRRTCRFCLRTAARIQDRGKKALLCVTTARRAIA